MFCEKCGSNNIEGAKFCTVCGSKINSEIHTMTDNVNINKDDTPYYQEHILSSWKTNPVRKLSNRLKIESIINLIIAIILILQMSLLLSILTDIMTDGFEKGFNDVLEIYTYNGEINKIPDFSDEFDEFNISVPSMGAYKHELSISLSLTILVIILLLTLVYCIVKFKSFKNTFKYSQNILSSPLDITKTAKKNKKKIKFNFILLYIIGNIFFVPIFFLPNDNFIPYFLILFTPFIISQILSFASSIINAINIKYVLNNDVIFNEIEKNHLKKQNI